MRRRSAGLVALIYLMVGVMVLVLALAIVVRSATTSYTLTPIRPENG